jgi:hypothetical protein
MGEGYMTRLSWAFSLTAILLIGIMRPAASHHSHSMFDHGQEVSITGTVTNFSFKNPHVFLYVDVENASGDIVNYWIEMGPIPRVIQRGVGPKTFQPGDAITVNMYPLTDGRPGGSYHNAIVADGKVYN